jgi:alkylation response protein AidB-like acyl-CoA dehydrogenase
MNFEFSDEHLLVREQARRFLKDDCAPAVVRAVFEGKQGFDHALWRKVIDLGWTATTIPEEFGGAGLSYLELVILAEELGRSLAPIPFSSSVYLATEALLLAGSETQQERWLPMLAAGNVIGTFALSEGDGRPTPRTLGTSVSRGLLSGVKLPVPDGDIADFCIVIARSDAGDGASLFLVELDQSGIKREVIGTLDPSRPLARMTLSDAEGEPLGADGEGWTLTGRILERAAILFAWEQVGGADAALEMAKNYALERYAFGRPIASYQAIKHRLANVYVKNTLARSNCYYGAWALNAGAADLSVAAAASRVSAIQAYYFASKENIQIHGGMGFTWESDCHLYYRRAKLLSVNIGSEDYWQDRLVAALEQRPCAAEGGVCGFR